MIRHGRLLLAVFATTALLGLGVGAASARSFSVTERNFELIWNNMLTGKTKLEFQTATTEGNNVTCDVTLLGHYSANTIGKRTEIDQGSINHGELSECEHGSATIKTETMPWRLRYRSFEGRLPSIERITIALIGAWFTVFSSSLSLSCEAITEINNPGLGIIESFSRGAPDNIRADETATIPFTEVPCAFASPARFRGTGAIRNLPRTAKITVTLI